MYNKAVLLIYEMHYNHILSQNTFSFMSAKQLQKFHIFHILYTPSFVIILLWHIFSKDNHLSYNGPLILLFILTRHWGQHSQSEPSFQTDKHKREPEFWQGILDSVSRPELSCLLAGRHVCSCKSHQIRSHRTGEWSVESHSSTAGSTLLCVSSKYGEKKGAYPRKWSLPQKITSDFSYKFFFKPKNLLFNKIKSLTW